MDTTKAVTHVGLCAGYGGIELGLKRAIPDLRTVALCEIEAFAVSNLVAKMEAGLMDPAPIWPDLKTFPYESFHGQVDILTGGYPCQPFSAAGQRKGKQDPRHLWPWIADGIRLLRPRICFFENVEGHISLGLSDVIEDLAGMGYRTTWGLFSASEVGAPHQRKRVFILAHCSDYRSEIRHLVGSCSQGKTGDALPCGKAMADSTSVGFNGCLSDRKAFEQTGGGSVEGVCAWPSRPGEQQYGWEPPRVVADSHRIDRSAPTEGREHDRQAGSASEELADTGISGCDGRPDGTSWGIGEPREAGKHIAGCRGEGHGVRQTQPPLGGDSDGSAGGLDYAQLCVSCDNRTDELRLLGNGVVPHTAELAFRVLIQELANE